MKLLSIDQFLLDSLLRSVMVELLQLQEGATVSPVVSLELLLIAINGVKMVQCSVEKQQRCSPSLFSDMSNGGQYTCEARGTPFTVVRQNQSVIIESESTI